MTQLFHTERFIYHHFMDVIKFDSSFSSKFSQEEMERRRIRRERNKVAAAKCRNRRRELTDSLQTVSECCANGITLFPKCKV